MQRLSLHPITCHVPPVGSDPYSTTIHQRWNTLFIPNSSMNLRSCKLDLPDDSSQAQITGLGAFGDPDKIRAPCPTSPTIPFSAQWTRPRIHPLRKGLLRGHRDRLSGNRCEGRYSYSQTFGSQCRRCESQPVIAIGERYSLLADTRTQ